MVEINVFTRKTAVLFDFDGVLVDTASDIALCVNAALSHFDLPCLSEKQIRNFIGDGSRALVYRSCTAASHKVSLSLELPQGLVEACHAWYIKYYYAHPINKSVPYKNVGLLLHKIRERGLYAGVVSNKPTAICKSILDAFGLTGFFDIIIGQEDMTELKPSPQGLELAIKAISAKIAHIDLPKMPSNMADEDATLCKAMACVAEDYAVESVPFFEGKTLDKNKETYPIISAKSVLMIGDSASDIIAGQSFGATTIGVTGGYGNVLKLMQAKPDIVVETVGELVEMLGENSL